MIEIPLLEHTSNDTDRRLIYHIQQGDTNFNEYYLWKAAILPGGVIQPEGVIIASDDLDWLHKQVVQQGFVYLEPTPEDDPRIMRVYL